jgi:cytoskeletal protein CcmA (bactofilin family)
MNEATHTMNVEKRTIRSDIPGHQTLLNTAPVEDTRRMTVGRGISLNGVIAACELLTVEGTVQAEGFKARRLEISESGLFSGTAEVQDAVISGRVEGHLAVPGRLVVKATARISADIEYGTLEVEAGARIEGRLSPIAVAMAAAPAEAAAQQPKAAAPVAVRSAVVQAAPTPAANVEKLFDERGEAPAPRSRVFRRAG